MSGGEEDDSKHRGGFTTSEHARRVEEIEALQGRVPLRLQFGRGIALSRDERRLLAEFIEEERHSRKVKRGR